jgi:hypothetical protein
VLTAETFTRELYCSWSINCRNQTTNTARYACALREQLTKQRMRVGPTQLGPKENDAAGLPSVWFEYDDGKRFLRQAVAVTDARAISLVLSAPSNEARAAHVRPFDQALRTLQLLTAEVRADRRRCGDADCRSPRDASTLLADGASLDAGVMFQSAPVPKLSPIGPCPTVR